MGFSTPAWIGQLAQPQAPMPNPLDAQRQGVLAGYTQGQQKAMYGALKNVDLGDQNSINAAANRLAQTGNGQVADALLSLSTARHQAGTTQSALGLADAGMAAARARQSDQTSQSSLEPHAQLMQDGADAVQALMQIQDPDARKAAADHYTAQFKARGIPDENISEITGDLSDDGLKAHEAFLRAAAQGNDATHPTGHAASRGLVQNQAYTQSQDQLTGPYSDPIVQAALAKAGIDIGPGMARATEITAPERGQEAVAAHAQDISHQNTAGTNLANTDPATAPAPFAGGVRGTLPNGQPGFVAQPGGPQGQTQVAANTALGSTAGGHGGEVSYRADGTPVVTPVQGAAPTAAGFEGALSGATAGASAAATAPYELVPGITDPTTGAPLYRTRADVAARNIPNAGITAQQQELNTASAAQYQSDKQAVANSQASLVPMRKVLDIVSNPANTTGPATQDINTVKSFVQSNLGWLPAGVRPDAQKIANMEEARKYMVQIAGAQAAQYGPGTNEKLAVAASGNANPDISNMAIADVMRMNLALKRAEVARTTGYRGAPEGYSDYAANFGRSVDPRAFMWDLQTPQERQKTLSTIKTPAEKRAFLKGREAATASGF